MATRGTRTAKYAGGSGWNPKSSPTDVKGRTKAVATTAREAGGAPRPVWSTRLRVRFPAWSRFEHRVQLVFLGEVQRQDGVKTVEDAAQVPDVLGKGAGGGKPIDEAAEQPDEAADLVVRLDERAGGVLPSQHLDDQGIGDSLLFPLVGKELVFEDGANRFELAARLRRIDDVEPCGECGELGDLGAQGSVGRGKLPGHALRSCGATHAPDPSSERPQRIHD